LKADYDVVLAAVNNNGNALKYAGGNLNNDKKVVVAAVTQKSRALQYASKELLADPDVKRAAGL
jgi:hypothetical protein